MASQLSCRIAGLVLASVLLPGIASATAQLEPGQAPAAEPVTEWQISKERSRISAVDGVIRAEGGPRGWARARRGVTDLELRLEFRVMAPDTSGALLVRAWTDRTNTFAKAGYRIALRSVGTPSERLGQIRGLSEDIQSRRPVADLSPLATGEWQRLEVRCEGDAIEVHLSGQLVHSATGSEPNAGLIGIEIDKGILEVRDMSMTPILDEPATVLAVTDLPSDAVRPRVRREVAPRYTADAMERRIQGQVELEGVVSAAGRVESLRVLRSLIPDLDAEAIAAVRQWRMDPARVNGAPVPVLARFLLTFKMH